MNVTASRAHGFVPSRGVSQACTRTALSRLFQHHFSPVQASPTMCLPPLYVPVSPSPVSREARRDLWSSTGPSTMVVFKLRTSLSAQPLCLHDSISIFMANRPVYYRRFRREETAATEVFDQRGRKKTAEFHKSGANRAEIWGGEVKCERWLSAWRWRRGLKRTQE